VAKLAEQRVAVTDDAVRDASVLKNALSIYFLDAMLAGAFVARGCAASGPSAKAVCSGCIRMSRRRGSGQC
jgi:hypothetical protein